MFLFAGGGGGAVLCFGVTNGDVKYERYSYDILNSAAGIYKIGPSKEFRYERKIASSKYRVS
jgi:hypothetical protein